MTLVVAGPCTFVVNAADLGLRVSHAALASPLVLQLMQVIVLGKNPI